MRSAVVPPGLVAMLGTSQLVCWGISYYLIGVFADTIVADTGWSRSQVHGGYSLALVAMGLTSARIGRLVDSHGGRTVMSLGSMLCALACLMLSLAEHLGAYYLAWLLLGCAMRMFLYDAAFAALARIAGREARQPISRITLLGGLASTVFWPFGHWLAASFGWRAALAVYAALALATLFLHRAIPTTRCAHAEPGTAPEPTPLVRRPRLCALLFAWIVTAAGLLNSAMSAHMIGLMTALGLGASLAIQVSALRGVGQTSARLVEVMFGRHWHAATLNLAATALLPIAFVAALPAPLGLPGAVAFALFYGSGNGLVTITRGSLPLAMFDARTYGHVVGRLLAPGFLFAAAAPLAFAWMLEAGGARAALLAAMAVAASMAIASLALWRFARPGA